jgi:hypothetical protein
MPLQLAILGPARLGNVRLGYLSAAIAAARAARARLRAAQVSIQIAGVDARVRVSGLTIRDVANDNPNTCSLTIDGSASPVVSQTLRVSLGLDAPRLLFNGSLQEVGLSYEGKPNQLDWPASALDDTPRANRRRPFGTWTTVSATTVAQYLVAVFAPGFTSTHVQAGLPNVSIILDGSEGMNGALKQITDLLGGWFFWEDGDLWLFNDPAFLTDLPDTIDATPGRFLDDPPIKTVIDNSQLRTRIFGKGHGEALLADVLAGDTILPVANAAAWFGTVGAGGHAIAIAQILAYTGVQAGGGGSLVGPGAAPSTAPALALVAGAGLGTGVYQYGYLDGTAVGKSLVSPLGTITTGVVAAPTTNGPTPTVSVGAGIDAGAQDYEYTFVNPSGETTPSPITTPVTTYDVSPPASGGSAANYTPGFILANWHTGDAVYFVVTFINAAGETPGAATNTVTASYYGTGIASSANAITITGLPISADPTVTSRRIYQNVNGAWFGGGLFGNNSTTTGTFVGGGGSSPAPPGANTAAVRQVALSTIPIGGPTTTARKIYRRFNGTGTFKLVTTIADNTTTSYVDTTANASLGAAAPSSNTATLNQVALTGVAIGATGTTSREIYRTAVNGSQLKLLTTLANNTATTFADSTADASLGANAPTADTSGLTQPAGQVNAGSATLLTASAGPFAAGGGWATLSSGQAIRYTGITGNTLTGIPPAGVGAILTTVLYGSQVLPAPALTGVTGIVVPIMKGTLVNLWVQRDDLTAQDEQAARDGSDGIVEAAPMSDERRGEASLIALCDATLARYSRPLVTVTYACRDVKTKSGKPITIDLVTPPIHQTLTIQEVTIDQIDIAPGLLPRFSVTASSVRQSLDGLLRQLLAAAA